MVHFEIESAALSQCHSNLASILFAGPRWGVGGGVGVWVRESRHTYTLNRGRISRRSLLVDPDTPIRRAVARIAIQQGILQPGRLRARRVMVRAGACNTVVDMTFKRAFE